jgi:hypothetical protein
VQFELRFAVRGIHWGRPHALDEHGRTRDALARVKLTEGEYVIK